MGPIQRIKDLNQQRADEALAATRHAEALSSDLNTQETIVKSFKILTDFLSKNTSKVNVVNQLREIGTPDVKAVVNAVESLQKAVESRKDIDLSPVTDTLKKVLEQAQKIPKELPKAPEFKQIDYQKQFLLLTKSIQSVEKSVKRLKLVSEAPVVNVPKAEVKVDPPDLRPIDNSLKDVVKAVKGITIPEYKDPDNSNLEKILKKIDNTLKDILDKPVGGSGGGGRATPYQDSAGIPQFVELNQYGSVPITSVSYTVLIDDASTLNVKYIGRALPGTATSAATWSIFKYDKSGSYPVLKWVDSGKFSQIYDDRVGLTYG